MKNESYSHKRFLDPLRGTGPYTVNGPVSSDKQDSGQPENIVLISVDMVPMEFHHSVTGGFPINTPNINSLSEDGVNFQNASEVPVEVSDEMRPGVVSLPHGWGHDKPGTRMAIAREHAGVNSNILAPGTFVDVPSGNAVVNGIPVEVIPT